MNLQEFVSSLTSEQKQTLLTILTNSPKLESTLEETRFSNGLYCPKCGSTEQIIKKGFYKGKQRYRCKSCNHIFTSTSNTFLSSTKKPLETWKKYFQCLINHFSLRKTSEICGISLRTSFMWRHKILDSLRQSNETKVSGIIESDETFFHVSYKGQKGMSQKGKVKKRGLSKDQVNVPCVIERESRVSFSQIGSLGKTSLKTLDVLTPIVEQDSILCTDKEKSYIKFSKNNHLEHIRLDQCKSKKGVYHIQNINSYHSRLKNFMRPFYGVSTKHLNNYLTWNNVIQEKTSKMTTQSLQDSLLVLCFKNNGVSLYSEISKRPGIPV